MPHRNVMLGLIGLIAIVFVALIVGGFLQQPSQKTTLPEGHYRLSMSTLDPPSIHSRGYSPMREQAMADFKKRWLNNHVT